MRKSRRLNLAVAATLWIVMCPSVRAAGFLESIFGFMSPKEEKSAIAHRSASHVRPSCSHGACGGQIRKVAHHKPKSNASQKSDGRPKLSEDEKFLSSASFSHRFCGCTETTQKDTQEAIDYLIAHDETLRRGDVLVTQSGAVVFDPDRGEDGSFLAADDRRVAKSLRVRLSGFAQLANQYGASLSAGASPGGKKYAGIDGSEIKTENPLEQTIQSPDGRTIRFVGGYMPEEGQSSTHPENTLRVTPSRRK
ncbi:hypothetical protein [uncultured Rhodoblastus sp.]|uniref:hypothetical protein n=1 Tax=uncultured Rhodoblastus sp. TaxID=543037 RepID=UPI0026014D76|nr:hypothetical protein [uncultured Rhodoblastus sp.]